MTAKTISLTYEAYARLKAARRHPRESSSEVILRARWPERTIAAGELLRRSREHGSLLTEEELDSIEEAKAWANQPPVDKWQE